MKYGYIRVSTMSQDYYRQQLQLQEYGVAVENIFEEKISGTKKACLRPAFEEMLSKLAPDDVCVFESMSRMARSMQDLIDTTNKLVKEYKVKVIFIKENLTIGGSSGDNAMNALIFNIMGSFAQFERDLIADRTKQGIKARRELDPNFTIGRPKTYDTTDRTRVIGLYTSGLTYKEIAQETGLSLATICRMVKETKCDNGDT